MIWIPSSFYNRTFYILQMLHLGSLKMNEMGKLSAFVFSNSVGRVSFAWLHQWQTTSFPFASHWVPPEGICWLNLVLGYISLNHVYVSSIWKEWGQHLYFRSHLHCMENIYTIYWSSMKSTQYILFSATYWYYRCSLPTYAYTLTSLESLLGSSILCRRFVTKQKQSKLY